MGRVRIAFVHISPGMSASFVRTDFEILRSKFEVLPVHYRGFQDLPRIFRAVSVSRGVVCWFAWDHALWAIRFARTLCKPSLLVTGGFDVVGLPEIQYGSLLAKRSASRAREIVRNATSVLAISESIRASVARFSSRTDVDVVPLGFDSDRFPLCLEKENLVITVGAVTAENLSRKGMSSFMNLAKSMPEVKFALVGSVTPEIESKIEVSLPRNAALAGHASDRDLVRWFGRAKVYVQLSAHEGFGAAVAEAMLAGCIPVVSDRGALPEVVGKEGIVVPWNNLDRARSAVASALSYPPEASVRARERIMATFSLNKRREALIATVDGLLSSDVRG